jgi:hypothetical protein
MDKSGDLTVAAVGEATLYIYPTWVDVRRSRLVLEALP